MGFYTKFSEQDLVESYIKIKLITKVSQVMSY